MSKTAYREWEDLCKQTAIRLGEAERLNEFDRADALEAFLRLLREEGIEKGYIV